MASTTGEINSKKFQIELSNDAIYHDKEQGEACVLRRMEDKPHSLMSSSTIKVFSALTIQGSPAAAKNSKKINFSTSFTRIRVE